MYLLYLLPLTICFLFCSSGLNWVVFLPSHPYYSKVQFISRYWVLLFYLLFLGPLCLLLILGLYFAQLLRNFWNLCIPSLIMLIWYPVFLSSQVLLSFFILFQSTLASALRILVISPLFVFKPGLHLSSRSSRTTSRKDDLTHPKPLPMCFLQENLLNNFLQISQLFLFIHWQLYLQLPQTALEL